MNLTHTEYVLIPLAASIGVVALAWLDHMTRTRRRERRNRGLIYRCSSCGRVYEDARHVPLSSCPGCRTLNEPVQRKGSPL